MFMAAVGLVPEQVNPCGDTRYTAVKAELSNGTSVNLDAGVGGGEL